MVSITQIFILIFCALFDYSLSLTPNWELTSSNSKEISETTNSFTSSEGVNAYTLVENGKNVLYIGSTKYDDVDFEGIEFFYKFNSSLIYVCPSDKNSKIKKISSGIITDLSLPNNMPTGDYHLRCYKHTGTNHIVVGFIGVAKLTSFDMTMEYNYWTTKVMYNSNGKLFNMGIKNGWTHMYVLHSDGVKVKLSINKVEIKGDAPEISNQGTESLGDYISTNEYDVSFIVTGTYVDIYYTETNPATNEVSFHHAKVTFDDDDNYNNRHITTSTLSGLPLQLSEPYTIEEVQFINSSPVCLYKVKTDSGKEYWGEADMSTGTIIFNSDIPITSIDQITYVDNLDSTGRGLLIKTQDGKTMNVCPYQTNLDTCPACSNYLLIDSVNGNKCVSSVPTGATENGKYVYCPAQTILIDNACKTCGDQNLYTLIPDGVCISETSCDTNIYIKTEANTTCTSCKGYNAYMVSQGSECKDSVPDGYYISDRDNNIISPCYTTCATCREGGNDNEQKCDSCLSSSHYLSIDGKGNCKDNCDPSSIYGRDESTMNCVICNDPSIGKVKVEGTDVCISIPDPPYFYYTDQTNGIIKMCNDGCSSCDSTSQCSTCITNYHKAEDFDTSLKCVASCGSSLGYYRTDNKCVSCKTGDHYRYKDDEECISNTTSFVIDKDFVVIDDIYNIIVNCPSNCDTCIKDTNSSNEFYGKCTACSTGYVEYNNQCLTCSDSKQGLFQGTCINCQTESLYLKEGGLECETMPSHYYVSDSINNIIKECPSTCLECIFNSTASKIDCTSCESGKFLEANNEGHCIDDCTTQNINLISDPSTNTCVNCATNGTFRYSSSTQCLNNRNTNTYIIDSDYGLIADCDSHCALCEKRTENDDSKCTKCDTSYYMLYGTDDCSSSCAQGVAPNTIPDSYFAKDADNKCIKCGPTQYKLESESQCISSPSYKYHIINSDYGIIGKCHPNCESCSSSSTDISNQQCDSCPSGSYLQPDNTGNCLPTCPSSYAKSTDASNSCINCASLSPPQYKDPTGDYCLTSIPSGHYVSDQTHNILSQCQSNCMTCSLISSTLTCSQCDQGFLLEYDLTTHSNSNNCVNSCEEGQIADGSNVRCINCKDSNKYLYNGECVDQPEGTFVDQTSTNDINYNKLTNCYSSCKTCSSVGSSANNLCLSCRDNYSQDALIPSNCNANCDTSLYYFYYDSSNVIHCTSTKLCPVSYPYLIESTSECVSSCSSRNKFTFNSKCVDSCPSGYAADSNKNCVVDAVREGECSYSEKANYSYDIIGIKSDLANEIASYATKGDSSLVNVIRGNGVSLIIFRNDTCGYNISLNHGISYANLSKCVDKIKSENNLSEDSELIIGQIEVEKKEQNTNSITGYIIADLNGNTYSIEPCKDDNIVVSLPLILDKLTDFLQAKELFDNYGIDIYDANEPFFNDFCFPFFDDNGNDVPLKNRRKDFFKNSSLCEEGCDTFTVDFKTARVNCECEVKENKYEEIIDNMPFIDFPDGLSMSNLIVVRCYKLVFNLNYFKKCIGGWIIISLLILEVPILINLLVVGFHPIYAFLNQYSQTRIGEEMQNNNKSIELDQAFPSPPIKKINNNMVGTDSPAVLLKMQDDKKFQMKKFDIHDKYNANSSSSNELKIYDQSAPEYTTQKETEEVEFDTEELDDLAYEDALEYDKRCIFVFYGHCLLANLSLINVFVNISVLEPICVRLIGFLLNISLFLVLNAMFYDDNYISDRYDKINANNFGYIIENELPKSVYASLISLVVGFLINYATSSRKRFETLMKKEKDHKKFLRESNKIISSMKKKLITFVIIGTVLIAFFWYYISAFCDVYQKTQIPWLVGSLITFVFCIVMQSILALIITLFRYIGLKCHISCFYTLSTYFV